MRSGLALVLAPVTALAVQSVMYALVTPSCAAQDRLALHASAAVALLIALLLTALAGADWSGQRAAAAEDDAGDPRSNRRFLAIVATAVAALSALVIVAMWFNLWVLSPCDPWP